MIEISVIIPAYKPHEYIFECLDSLKKQTLSKDLFEIIIILNGEKSPYFENIQNYININFHGFAVTLLYTDVAGVSHARNIGIEYTHGRFIAFIDDDDVVSECYLQEMYTIAACGIMPLSYEKDFINNTFDSQDDFLTCSYQKNKDKKLSIWKARSYFSTVSCKLLDKKSVDTLFNTKIPIGEDTLFMFALSKEIHSLQFTSTNAVYYRRVRPDSSSRRKRSFAQNFIICAYSITAYIALYLKNNIKFNFIFFITRVLSCFRVFGK